MPQFDRAPLEEVALTEYNEQLGKLLEVNYICGYTGNDSGDWMCDPPIIVRLDATDRSSILHWNDEWLDPYWDVTLISGTLPVEGIRSLWIDGRRTTPRPANATGKE